MYERRQLRSGVKKQIMIIKMNKIHILYKKTSWDAFGIPAVNNNNNNIYFY